MEFLSDVSSMITSLKKYEYINSFYDLISDGQKMVSEPRENALDIQNEDLLDLLNFFKEAKNTAKSEMDNALLEGLEIVRVAADRNSIKAHLLNFIAGRYLWMMVTKYKLYNTFLPNLYEKTIRARASKYIEDIAKAKED